MQTRQIMLNHFHAVKYIRRNMPYKIIQNLGQVIS